MDLTNNDLTLFFQNVKDYYDEKHKEEEPIKQKDKPNINNSFVNYFVQFWNNRIYSYYNMALHEKPKEPRVPRINPNLIRNTKFDFSKINLNKNYDSDYDIESDTEESEYEEYDFDTYENTDLISDDDYY